MMAVAPRWRIPAPRVRIVTTLAYGAIPAAADTGNNDQRYAGFRAQLELIRRQRKPVSTIRDLCQSNGNDKPRAKTGHAIVLTFDDGIASHADPVLPMLWERRMAGEFFINPALVGRRGYLSWNELRGMASAGMSIQSHGYSHRPLDRLEQHALVNELGRSRKVIEDRLGHRVAVFAAPHGRINRAIVDNARRVGYRAVCHSTPGYWQPGSGQCLVPRLLMRPDVSEQTLCNWLEHQSLAMVSERCRHVAVQLWQRTFGPSMPAHLQRHDRRENRAQ